MMEKNKEEGIIYWGYYNEHDWFIDLNKLPKTYVTIEYLDKDETFFNDDK